MQIRESLGGTLDFKLDDGHCIANCGVGKDWITVYLIETEKEYHNQGECQRLLMRLKKIAEEQNKRFAIWQPMNSAMVHIANKLSIKIIEE